MSRPTAARRAPGSPWAVPPCCPLHVPHPSLLTRGPNPIPRWWGPVVGRAPREPVRAAPPLFSGLGICLHLEGRGREGGAVTSGHRGVQTAHLHTPPRPGPLASHLLGRSLAHRPAPWQRPGSSTGSGCPLLATQRRGRTLHFRSPAGGGGRISETGRAVGQGPGGKGGGRAGWRGAHGSGRVHVCPSHLPWGHGGRA